jgi:hypothetical protein
MTNEITVLSSGKFVATDSGLVVNGSPSFDEWMAYGKMLHRINRALQMVIGDWLNEGEKRYGETYAQATALWPDMQQDTLRDWKWVSAAVKKSLRKDNLHYSHYSAVAPLPPDEQREWLALAVKDSLTSHDLRGRIKMAKNGSTPPPPAPLRDALLALAAALADLSARRDVADNRHLRALMGLMCRTAEKALALAAEQKGN